jgi:hypothetical protein
MMTRHHPSYMKGGTFIASSGTLMAIGASEAYGGNAQYDDGFGDPAFGPDDDHAIDPEEAITITVPAKWQAQFTFSSEAAFENAIVIYDAKTLEKLHVAGNYGHSLEPWTFDDTEDHARHLLITGWNKQGAGDDELAWNQSLGQAGPHDGHSLEGGFEDSDDMDFNDVAFLVEIHK